MTLTQAELLIRPPYISLRCLLSHPPAQTIAVGKSDLWQETCTACDQAGFHKVSDYDAVLFIGGEGPMYTFYNDDRVHKLAADFYKAGKITGVLCHGTCL